MRSWRGLTEYLYLALFGMSFAYLSLAALLPILIACHVAMLSTVLAELTPRRKAAPLWSKPFWRWFFHHVLWDATQAFLIIWYVTTGITFFGAVVFGDGNSSPPEHYERKCLYFLAVLLIFSICQFFFLRFQITKFLDKPRNAILWHCLFYGLAMSAYFAMAWLLQWLL